MERADAARTRARELAAAARLFAENGAGNTTMDDIARAAGVGRATLYRRYPDRASIAVALLDEHERALQERMIRGDPPLGPGAPPADRLAAFYAAMVDLLETHGHLALATEVGASRYATAAHGFWRTHVRALAHDAGAPDPDVLTDVLLAALAPDLYRHQRGTLGYGPARISAALAELARATLS
ncbi:TetR/AcrR family transcriptional regulator [Virgisporangium ochraceum]